MKFSFQQAFRAFIMLGFAAFIMSLHWSGEIGKYINPKYESLSKTAALIFLFLFIVQLTRIWNSSEKKNQKHSCDHGDACHHDHGQTPFTFKKVISYSIILLPLLSGYLLPAKTLDASMAASKGGALLARETKKDTKTNESTSSEELSIDESVADEDGDSVTQGEHESTITGNQTEMSEEKFEQLQAELQKQTFIDMKNDLFSTYYELIHEDIQPFEGKKIKLTGFVYKEDGLSTNQLVISRFLVTHCVADASVIGFLTEFDEAAELEQDSWIEAEGVIKMGRYNDMDLPVIEVTKWRITKEPKEPYVYPIVVKLL